MRNSVSSRNGVCIYYRCELRVEKFIETWGDQKALITLTEGAKAPLVQYRYKNEKCTGKKVSGTVTTCFYLVSD